MIREKLSESLRRRRDGILAAIFAAHAIVAMLLVPMHLGVEALPRKPWFDNDAISDLTRTLSVLLLIGVTHGVAVAQLWIVGMAAVLVRVHWAIRFVAAIVLWWGLLVCWSIIAVVRDPHPTTLRIDYSQFTEVGPMSAMIVSLGYLLLVALSGWIARQIWGFSFAFGEPDLPVVAPRWQIGIGDLLIATALIAGLLSFSLWSAVFWSKAIEDALQSPFAIWVMIGHSLISTPLIMLAAYRTATRAAEMPRARGRLTIFLLACALETIVILIAKSIWNDLTFYPGILLAGISILVLSMVGTQLIVTVVTLRALIAAGGRLLRASDAATAKPLPQDTY